MNKKELKKALQKEVERQEKAVEVLKEFQSVDLSRFEGKEKTKRIITFLNNNLTQSKGYFKSLGLTPNYIITLYYKHNGSNESLDLYITSQPHENLFNLEETKTETENYIKVKTEEIQKGKNDIKNLTKNINLYNKIIELQERLQDETSYMFRQANNYKREYNNRISTPSKDDYIKEYIQVNNIENNHVFKYEKKQYRCIKTVKKQYKDFTIYNYDYESLEKTEKRK